jgi:hypothetical protein
VKGESVRCYFFSSFIGGLMPVGDGALLVFPLELLFLLAPSALSGPTLDEVGALTVFGAGFDVEQPFQQATTASRASKAKTFRILCSPLGGVIGLWRSVARSILPDNAPVGQRSGCRAFGLRSQLLSKPCVSPVTWYCCRVFQSRVLSPNS